MNLSFDYFLKGAISGGAGILCSHPIDTIKSNVQDKKPVRFTPRFLLKGIAPPFFGMGLEKAIVFGVYHNTRRLMDPDDTKTRQHRDRAVAGAVAGFAASFVVTPIERLKILAQTQTGFSSIRNLKPSFLFQGLSSTFTREMPGFAIYFSSYEMMKERVTVDRHPGMVDHFWMGGVSGFMSWFFIYPQDLVKTRIQASTESLSPISIVRDILKQSGVRGFFRGFHLALLRAVPLHAGTFAMFEFLNKS